MKKSLILLLSGLTFAGIFAEPLVHDALYRLNNIPAELTASVTPGKEVEFKLEEKVSAGFVWSAVFQPKLCRVELKHKHSNGVDYAEFELKPLTGEPCTVLLNYVQPSGGKATPVKTIKCVLTPQGRTAAPPPVSQTVPVNLPVLNDDAYLSLDRIPSAMQARCRIGKEFEFELQENPEAGEFWSVKTPSSGTLSIKLKHDASRKSYKPSKAEIELEPQSPGTYKVEFSYASGRKTFTVYLTATGF